MTYIQVKLRAVCIFLSPLDSSTCPTLRLLNCQNEYSKQNMYCNNWILVMNKAKTFKMMQHWLVYSEIPKMRCALNGLSFALLNSSVLNIIIMPSFMWFETISRSISWFWFYGFRLNYYWNLFMIEIQNSIEIWVSHYCFLDG